ncbi:MAG: hypothetical protein HYS98_07410 [Deltaproteobacteria bacterium]|nr:hypothetical protein [Deltaproteobacteria bacterium]
MKAIQNTFILLSMTFFLFSCGGNGQKPLSLNDGNYVVAESDGVEIARVLVEDMGNSTKLSIMVGLGDLNNPAPAPTPLVASAIDAHTPPYRNNPSQPIGVILTFGTRSQGSYDVPLAISQQTWCVNYDPNTFCGFGVGNNLVQIAPFNISEITTLSLSIDGSVVTTGYHQE